MSAPTSLKPPGFDDLVKEIESCCKQKGTDAVHLAGMKKCMAYLDANYLGRHWYCDDYMFPITSYCIMLFSFPVVKWLDRYKPIMAKYLAECPRCISYFSNAMANWRLDVSVRIGISTKQFITFEKVVNDWQTSTLLPILETTANSTVTQDEVLNGLLACLCRPNLLRNSPELKEKFNQVLSITNSRNLLQIQHPMIPGLIYLLFDGTVEQRKWAERMVISMKENMIFTKETIIPTFINEFSGYFYTIQDSRYFSEKASLKFWSNFYILFDIVDNEVFIKHINQPLDITAMSEHLNIKFYPLVRVFFNNIMAFVKEPLPVLLKLLNQFFRRFGAEFWQYSNPFTFVNVLDLASHPEVARLLIKLPEVSENGEWCLDDITAWMPNLLTSVTGSQQQTACVRLLTFLLKLTRGSQASFVGSNSNKGKLLSSIAFQMLLIAFELPKESLDFRQEKLSSTLLTRVSLRTILEGDADMLVTLAIQDNLDSCIQLISRALEYDLTLLAHNTKVLLEEREPTSYDTYPLLWTSLSSKPIYSHNVLTTDILKLLSTTASSIKFIQRKSDDSSKRLQAARKQHNSNVTLIFDLLSSLLEKISLGDPLVLKDVFSSTEGSNTIWSCIFSPLISQAALDILYQVFDIGVGGRFEAIQSLLSSHLSSTLNAININLVNLTEMRAYEPCPKAIRLLMDISKALFDPLTGVISSTTNRTEIELFWSRCWEFLVMVYQKTLTWAPQFHLEELIEFARDTLDLGHILVDSFRIIIDNVGIEQQKLFFADFMLAFKSVIVWLRLGETSLLNSCVDLVLKGFDLAKDLEFAVDTEFIDGIARYGAKAKRFNNKLSENQRFQILAKAREFDDERVEKIVQETQKLKSKRKNDVVEITSEEAKVSELASYKYQTHAKVAKQQTLSRFGVTTKEIPQAPPPKELKSSSIESIRNELKNSRTPLVKSTTPVVINAPRPAGFNSKKAAAALIGRSLNGLKKKRDSDSSEDEEEETVDLSDLFVDKKKKAKIIEVDINGKPIVKMSRDSKLAQARRDEENMRLRLNISHKPLYSNILKWNFNSTDEFPVKDRSIYLAVQNTYTDVKEYIKITEPLLMLECWQGIQSCKQTGYEEPFELLVGSRTTVDGFFDVYSSCKKTIIQNRKVGDSDLLVIGFINPGEFGSSQAIAAHLKNPNTKTCLAKVREIKSANADYSDITFRVYPGGSMMGVLTPKSNIVAMRVMQMTTVEREYASLKGLQYYDLKDQILQAAPNDPVTLSDEEAKEMQTLYNVNKSQATAIVGSFNTEGFSLIQGPPGTGKTKTILGIVGYSLSQQITKNAIQVEGKTAESSAKILICAPSNAAVDELVLRLREGVRNYKGETMPLRVVRLGRSDAVNAAVRDLTLEELVDKELQAKSNDTSTDPQLRLEHTKCIAERDKLREELKDTSLNADQLMELEDKLRGINKKRNELAKKLDDQRERVSIAYRTRDIDRRNLQAKILNGAQVICSTLSGSAHDFLVKLSIKFDQVIVDEACQCVELSALIPLRYGCKKCVMVGDPNQLPPTVLSQAAASFQYEQSLFVRMQKANPNSVYLLDVQYRMHPEISKFPSYEFYKSKLQDGEGMLAKNEKPWHKLYPLSPYRFFDIVSRHERNDLSRSLFNTGEARVALELVQKIMALIPPNEFAGRVGIISPYKEQIRTLKDTFVRKFGSSILMEIDFNTVDGFQGQEKDIIIMSCVRASDNGNVGFLSDVRRMNVALTRAKTSLWILGNKDSLLRNKVWKRLLQNAEERGAVTKAYPGFLEKAQQNTVPKRTRDEEDSRRSKNNNKPKKTKADTITGDNVQVLQSPTPISQLGPPPSNGNNSASISPIPSKPALPVKPTPPPPLLPSGNAVKSGGTPSRYTPVSAPRNVDPRTEAVRIPLPNNTGSINPPYGSNPKPTSSGFIPNNPSKKYTAQASNYKSSVFKTGAEQVQEPRQKQSNKKRVPYIASSNQPVNYGVEPPVSIPVHRTGYIAPNPANGPQAIPIPTTSNGPSSTGFLPPRPGPSAPKAKPKAGDSIFIKRKTTKGKRP